MKIKPGVYPDVPMSIYSQWDAANFSTIKLFRRSAAHAREMMVNPPDQTPAMLLGSGTHAAVLEPVLFKAEWATAPVCDKRTKVGKKTWADFVAANEGKEILTASEYEQCEGMMKGAHANPNVMELINNPGHTELSFVWIDEETGILCKGRIDRFGRLWGNSVIADLKTTENASEDAWNYEVRKYLYHVQAAFYLDGLEAAAPAIGRKFIWIALEKNPPHAVALYEPDEATIDKGRRMYHNYLRQWGLCKEAGVWPGYATGIQPLLLPDWALRTEEGEDGF